MTISGYSYQISHEDDSQMICLVRRKDGLAKINDNGDPVPRYMRTRKITVQEIMVDEKPSVLVVCDCHYFNRKKGPCRHFYAVIKRAPIVEDFSPECYKAYELYYGENKDITDEFDRIIDMIESNGGLVLKYSLAEFKMNLKEQYVNLGWYERTYNDIGEDTTPRSDSLAKNLSLFVPKDTKSNILGTLSDTSKQSAYSRTKKIYNECTDNATSEEDVKDMIETLNRLNGRILGRKKQANNGNPGSLGSFPSVVKVEKLARLKPPGSPRKK